MIFVFGQGEGLHGSSYAIPTKNKSMQSRSLSHIHISITKFIEFARNNPNLKFQVTQVGCGLAGYKASEIAPMFIGAPDNCCFDTAWKIWLGSDYKYWGTR